MSIVTINDQNNIRMFYFNEIADLELQRFFFFIISRTIFVYHHFDRSDLVNHNEIQDLRQQYRRVERLKLRMQSLKTRVDKLDIVQQKFRFMKELQKRVQAMKTRLKRMKNRLEEMKDDFQTLNEIMTTLQKLIILLLENTNIFEDCAKYIVRRIDLIDDNV